MHKGSSWSVQPEHRHNTPTPLCDVTWESQCGKGARRTLSSFLLYLKPTGGRSGESGPCVHPAQIWLADSTPASGILHFAPPLHILGGPTAPLATNTLVHWRDIYLWAKEGKGVSASRTPDMPRMSFTNTGSWGQAVWLALKLGPSVQHGDALQEGRQGCYKKI